MEAKHKKWIEQIENKIIELIVVESPSIERLMYFLDKTKIDQNIILGRIKTMLQPKNITRYSIDDNKKLFLQDYILSGDELLKENEELKNILETQVAIIVNLKEEISELSGQQRNTATQYSEHEILSYDELPKHYKLSEQNDELKKIQKNQSEIMKKLTKEIENYKKNRTMNR